jgi:hypothetical protein
MGVSKKMDMPKDIAEEVQAVMETAGKIKGEDFTDAVKFVMNVNGLLGMFAENFEPLREIQEHPNSDRIIRQMQEMITNILTTLSSMYMAAKNLPPDDVPEVLKTADTMKGIVDEYARRVNKDKS